MTFNLNSHSLFTALLDGHLVSTHRLLRADVPLGPAVHHVQADQGGVLCSVPTERGSRAEGHQIWRYVRRTDPTQ